MTDTKRQDTAISVVVGRRRFLTWVMASPALAVAARLDAAVAPDEATFDLYLAIRADGRILTTLPRTELGQGITTGVAMLVAEELDANLSAVDVRTADAGWRWLIQLTGSGIAVAAQSFAQALAARDALRISWAPGPASSLSDADIRSRLRDAMGARPLPPLFTTQTLEGRFDFPYLAHAPMETQSCAASVTGDHAELWLGAQDPKYAQREVAAALGWSLTPQRITVHTARAGGGFGRRFFAEAAVEAALVSRALGRPVKLMWTRNDEMRQGHYRPASHHRILAYLGPGGSILGWHHRAAIPTVEFPHGFGDLVTAMFGTALPVVTSAVFFGLTQHVPYQFGLVTQELRDVSIPVPTGSFRSVFTSQVGVANEIFVDQLARALGRDPVELRRSRLSSSRLRAVLDKVVLEGAWGRPLPPGVAQGVAVLEEWDSAIAHLIEVDVTGAAPRVVRVVIAADVGLPINPKSIEAQLQGAAIDAMSTTLSAGLHIDAGAVREGSFADYHWLRMRHSPSRMEVHLIRSDDRIGGVGELGYPSAAAALANAIARATGTMPTQFPILDAGA